MLNLTKWLVDTREQITLDNTFHNNDILNTFKQNVELNVCKMARFTLQ